MVGVQASLDHDEVTVVNLVLLEDLSYNSNVDPPCSRAMVESLWGLMPRELVERVLLFLPACSQARFQSVCKRWRVLMTSLRFREETTSIAFRRGHLVCLLKVEGPAHLMDESVIEEEAVEAEEIRKWFKVLKVGIPGLVLPPLWNWDSKVFTGADLGLPLVGVACWQEESGGDMRCWLLNVAERTWRELPRLALSWDGVEASSFSYWDIWLVPAAKKTDFRVLVLDSTHPRLTYLHSYSSTSGEWRTTGYPRGDTLSWQKLEDAADVAQGCLKIAREKVLIGEGRYIVTELHAQSLIPQSLIRFTWEGLGTSLCMLPDLPMLHSSPLSHSQGDDVLAYGPRERTLLDKVQGVFLYKLSVADSDSNCSTCHGQWECLFAQQLPPCYGLMGVDEVTVMKAQIIGHMVILLTLVQSKRLGTGTFWTMAYHMLDRSWKWQSMQGMDPYIGRWAKAKQAYYFVCVA